MSRRATPTMQLRHAHLEELEGAIYQRKDGAAGLVVDALNRLKTGAEFRGHLMTDEHRTILYTRLAAAIGAFLADPGNEFSEEGYGAWCAHYPTLQAVFECSALEVSDYLAWALASNPQAPRVDQLIYEDPAALAKWLLAYNLNSTLDLDIEKVYRQAARTLFPLWAAQCSTQVVLTGNASLRRQKLLELADAFEDIQVPDEALAPLADVFMYCSYATHPGKHAVKQVISRIFAKAIARKIPLPTERELEERRRAALASPKKPTCVVPIEWFNSFHAMYRCYAPLVEQLSEKFRLVAIAREQELDATAKAHFDKVIPFPGDRVVVEDFVRLVLEARPDVIYYPSVGMALQWVALASVRLAPVQVFTLGHPATTGSDAMDYAVVEPGAVANPDLMAERLVVLPPRSTTKFLNRPDFLMPPRPDPRPLDQPLPVAIPAMSAKVNPVFLEALAKIEQASTRPIEWQFFANALGATHHQFQKHVGRWLKRAVVHPRMAYPEYQVRLGICELSLSTFPFGGTNSVVDALQIGVPVVALDGDEPHSRFDGILLRYAGLDGFVVQTVDDYVALVKWLAEDPALLAKARQKVADAGIEKEFYSPHEGDASGAFARAIWHVFRNHEAIVASGAREVIWNDFTKDFTTNEKGAP